MWSNRHESTEVLRPRFKNEEGSCIFISRISTSSALCRVDWKCCRFESIQSNRHKLFPLLSNQHTGGQFTRDATSCESSRVVKCLMRIEWSLLPCFKNEEGIILFHGSWLPVVRINAVWIESNRKVPQTNRLSLGVLDMDDQSLNDTPHGSILLQTT